MQLANRRRGDPQDTTKIPFTWSERSAKQNYIEYTTVITALRQAIRSNRADATDRHTIIKLLRSVDMNPIRLPRTCYLTDSQWLSVSRALRDWHAEFAPRRAPIPNQYPKAYGYMMRAKGVSPEYG